MAFASLASVLVAERVECRQHPGLYTPAIEATNRSVAINARDIETMNAAAARYVRDFEAMNRSAQTIGREFEAARAWISKQNAWLAGERVPAPEAFPRINPAFDFPSCFRVQSRDRQDYPKPTIVRPEVKRKIGF